MRSSRPARRHHQDLPGDYLLPEQVVAPGATRQRRPQQLFAGAKEVHVVNAYNSALGLRLFRSA